MAKDGPGGERTEKPTPQRLKKARKEGQIPRTPELGTWIGVAAASVLLPMLVGKSFTTVEQLFVHVGAVAKHPETSAISALIKTTALASVVLTTVGKAKGLVASAGALPLSSVAATFADCAVLLMRT